MTRHLGMDVRAYVDRSMDPRVLLAFDRHLVACEVCRYAAENERRLVASLRDGATPGVPTDLHAMLLRMASLSADPGQPPPPAGTAASGVAGARRSPLATGPGVPSIPVAPTPLRPIRLPTVAPAAPAMHRSPRRAAVLAGLAAGASAAAAIGLSLAGPGQATATVRQPVVGATLSNVSTVGGSFSASFGTGAGSVLPQASSRRGGR